MADFIQDSIAQRLNALSKQPNTQALRDSATSEVVAFLEDLKSPGNPQAQRIDDYIVDDVSGNTPARRAANIYVIISKVKLTPTADFIVLQTEIGEGVVITTEA
jgi:phage tail sheath protein FI